MNDDTIERDMSEVLSAATSSLNNRKLGAAITRKRGEEDGRQILTRAEVRLEAEEDRHTQLVREKTDSREQIARTKASLTQLQELLATEEKNLADIEIEDTAVLRSIDSLRSQGIELPK